MKMVYSPIRTLVIDDDKSITRLICKFLADRFAERLAITATDDVQMALGMVTANQFDLCITDLDMPSVNGFKLLKAIKEIDTLTQVIILMQFVLHLSLEPMTTSSSQYRQKICLLAWNS
jgi:DNA-binding NtrC family response regulator